MTLRWYTAVIESRDPNSLARWWAAAIGWQVFLETGHEVVILPPWAERLMESLPFTQGPPGMVFVPVEHAKAGKNRLHLDFAPHVSQDRDAEIARLIDLGASRVDVGQGDKPWDVLADPDGNEFCILSSREI